MATIRPFRGIRPNPGTGELPDLELIRMRLEPHKGGGGPGHEDCIEFLESLLANGNYITEDQECFYIYECSTAGRSRTGIFALTALRDLMQGKILTHEHTLETMEDQICRYREAVGLEGASILLTYEPSPMIEALLELTKTSRDGFDYTQGENLYRFWRVNDQVEVSRLRDAFSMLPRVYLADGHHRLSATKKLNKISSQWISSLYVSTDELEIEPFHRLLALDRPIDLKEIMGRLGGYFFRSSVPNNIPYRPDQRERFGMYLGGIWYQLDLRPELKTVSAVDADFLQRKVIADIFGIENPKTNPKLRSYADSDWKKLLLELAKEPSGIVFTLFGISTEDFLKLSCLGSTLPPKSTSIGPKPLYGMLMHSVKDTAGEVERI